MARINLMSLDGIELTDDGRTFTFDRDDKIVKVELANGSRKQYVKAVKKVFNIEWKWMPSLDTSTSDGLAGRNTLVNLCLDGNVHTLILRDTSGVTQTYAVFVDSYNEQIIRREYQSGVYFYNVSLKLGQQ